MKNILFLLLLIPILSHSQITYKDVMEIKSVDMFKKVVIENGYEFDRKEGDWIIYGYNILRDSLEGNRSTTWGRYNSVDDRWSLLFSRTSLLGEFLGIDNDTSNPYDLIVDNIKSKCKYDKIVNYKPGYEEEGDDYVTYSCSESKYKGKIGFVIVQGWGVIRHFPPLHTYQQNNL